MATVRHISTNSGLAMLDALPSGFLDCGARDLHRLLRGPTLIELEGERGRPLFVSVLLHGNEDSGFTAVQQVLRHYQQAALPRAIMLLIGNVEAASRGLRRLDSQPDYNRVWPGTTRPAATPEARLMAAVHARVVVREPLAAIDFHNNTGRNPHYAVICDLEPYTLGLASLFSRRAVCFRGLPGTQTASFAGLLPAITAECGLPSEPANAEAAARFLDAVLSLDELPNGAPPDPVIELYHTLGVVRLRDEVSFSFGRDHAELCFESELDRHNFQRLERGTVLGETSHPMPLRMIDETGADVAADYFETSGCKLKLRKEAVPAMFTVDPKIVRQDCLCYLMEPI